MKKLFTISIWVLVLSFWVGVAQRVAASDPFLPECGSAIIVATACQPVTENGPRFRLRR